MSTHTHITCTCTCASKSTYAVLAAERSEAEGAYASGAFGASSSVSVADNSVCVNLFQELEKKQIDVLIY